MMNTRLREMADLHADGRLVCFLEGGYNLDVMGMCSLILLQELVGIDTTSFDDNHKESKIASEYTEKLIEKIVADSPLL
jgi:acetoin utilization deacetylase AcuC-like enzyme